MTAFMGFFSPNSHRPSENAGPLAVDVREDDLSMRPSDPNIPSDAIWLVTHRSRAAL